MIVRTLLQRLREKSYSQCLALRLAQDYDLSPVEATTLSEEIIQERSQDNPSFLADGQLWYTVVSKEEPAGKPLSRCQKVRVRLTVFSAEDLAITEPEERRQLLVHRLSWEAYEQGALLTVEDLARLLITSERTISRILTTYARQDIFIPTRGRVRDIGPVVSHKAQAVHLYLKGLTATEIATRLGHHLNSVERYLDDFCLVMMGLEEGYSPARIARNARLGEKLVEEYASLYRQYSSLPEYTPIMARLQERLAYLLKKSLLQGGEIYGEGFRP
jgi:hypothetical protein